MKKQLPFLMVKIVFIGILGSLLVLFFAKEAQNSSVLADSCPDNYTDEQCLDYLEQKQKEIQKEQQAVKEKLNAEKSAQSSLYAQINSIDSEIKDNELTIQEKEVQIEITTLEVTSLAKEITLIKTTVDTLLQEQRVIENTINKRLVDSYKFSMIPPWTFLLQGDGLGEIMENIHYFMMLRKEDKTLLEELNASKLKLDREYVVLEEKQEAVIAKRNDIEKENAELLSLRSELEGKREKKEALLAESRARAQQYANQKSQYDKKAAQIDQELTAVALRMMREGQLGSGTKVSKGDIIGFQGHTGCSFGSHLHYGIARYSSYYANINPFSSGYLRGSTAYGAAITSGSGRAPLNGARTTQGFHAGYSVDMVSYSDGNQSGDMYYKKKGQIKCPASINPNAWLPGYFPLRGEGAPIYALFDGTVYSGVDQYGGKYTIINHGQNGLVSLYWHLR